MPRCSTLAALTLFAGLTAAPALAQGRAAEGMDYDTLAACSVVYQQVGQIYIDQGEPGKSLEFSQAATAYGASALHMLGYEITDSDRAVAYSDARMLEVVDSLNAASEQHEDGDMGVIAEWLPYCDELGPLVNQALAARQTRGW